MTQLRLTLLLGLLAAAASLFGQASIMVERVKFDALSDNWMQVEIELMCLGNPSPTARNADFVENITVKPLLGFALANGQFQFYSASVEIMVMEARHKNSVYFYLPGPIVERDGLPARPKYYSIELSVGGVPQDPSESGKALSRTIRDFAMLKNMQAKASTQLMQNNHLLLPIYATPAKFTTLARNQPVFIRREVQP
jgi:hypothetical protein